MNDVSVPVGSEPCFPRDTKAARDRGLGASVRVGRCCERERRHCDSRRSTESAKTRRNRSVSHHDCSVGPPASKRQPRGRSLRTIALAAQASSASAQGKSRHVCRPPFRDPCLSCREASIKGARCRRGRFLVWCLAPNSSRSNRWHMPCWMEGMSYSGPDATSPRDRPLEARRHRVDAFVGAALFAWEEVA